MARMPRLYRVHAQYRNGETATRHYQTPEAAEERRLRFLQGRNPQLSQASLDAHREAGTEPQRDIPEVTVTPSHPITYPRALGDSLPFDIPDSIMSLDNLQLSLDGMGVDPAAIEGIDWQRGNQLVLTLSNGKRAPRTWRVEITERDE